MLDEGDQRGGHRHDLLGRDVHEVDLGRRHVVDLAAWCRRTWCDAPTRTPAPCGPRRTSTRSSTKLPLASSGGVGLGDDVLLLLVGCEVDDLVGDLAVDDLAVRRLDEAVLVDPAVGGQVAHAGRCSGLPASRSGTCGRSATVCTSRTSKPARSRERPPGPRADRRRLWVRPDSGLTWSMNCDSWLVPKNSLMAATTGRMLMSVWGVMASTSWVVMRSRTTRSMRDRPTRTWFWISSPTDCGCGGWRSGPGRRGGSRARRWPGAACRWRRRASRSGCSTPWLGSGRSRSMSRISAMLLDLRAQLAVQLVAADPGEVVALVVEEGVLEVGLGRLDRRRLARTGPLVDLDAAPLRGWARGRAPSPTGRRGSRSGGRSARGRRRPRSRGRAGGRR